MILNSNACVAAFRSLYDALLDGDDSRVTLRFEDTRRVLYCEKTYRLTDEKYRLTVEGGAPAFTAEVLCSGEKSGFYGLCDLARRLLSGNLSAGVYEEAPAFPTRGYIEGFYGRPWSADARLEMVAFAAKHRLNAVYYAPKDDPYHRKLWRVLYPAEELAKLKKLLREAERYYMTFSYCIAPGLSVRYADPLEFQALMTKTRQLYDLGVRSFGLLLDDIGENLYFPEDRARYGETVNAHIDLICRYEAALAALDPSVRLTVCPTVYHGSGEEYYIAKLGQNVSPAVSLFWTGRDICSRELTEIEALRFFEATFHKPLYWDNYPVNDMAMHHEMHLGPLINRGPLLHRCAQGLIANCMEYAQCSRIPLATVADYLWDPEGYTPETSWRRAVTEAVGAENAAAFLTFADLLRSSCLLDENAKELKECFFAVGAAYAEGDAARAEEIAEAYLRKMRACLLFLQRDLPICRELKVWAEKFALLVPIAQTAFRFMGEKKESQAALLHKQLTEYNALPAKLADDMDFLEVLDGNYEPFCGAGL